MRAFIFILLLILSPAVSAFSIFSMNLYCGLGDWKQRVDIVVSEIVKESPDVIGLQEVCYNSKMNMGAYIREELMKRGYPVKAMETQDTHRSFLKYQEQLLLISRHEATATKKGALPSVPLLRNGYVTMKIGSRWFLTTHLHFALPKVREKQFAAIQEAFGNEPTIIFGDLNSNPDDSETNILVSSGWTSVFDGPTYPSDNPKKTFDGFWMSKTFYDEVSATTMERIFFPGPFLPSDHLAVHLTLLYR